MIQKLINGQKSSCRFYETIVNSCNAAQTTFRNTISRNGWVSIQL